MLGPRRIIGKLKSVYAGLIAPTKAEKAAQLAAQFPHLTFAEGTCEKFIDDLVKDDLVKKDQVNMSFKFQDDLLRRFLLSTDYVQNGGKTDREINYMLYYSPWSAPCYNPYTLMNA